MKTTALLLIAHGSRQVEANADLHHLAGELQRRGCYAIVEPAFLELAEPTIAQAAERCIQQGAERVIMVPYFLSAGVHVKRDLQDQCQQLDQRFRPAVFLLAEPLGRHPLLIEVVVERARQADEHARPGC
jgi:sirohydrochlorin ferrochelatase